MPDARKRLIPPTRSCIFVGMISVAIRQFCICHRPYAFLVPPNVESSLVRTSSSLRSSSHLRTIPDVLRCICRFPACRSDLPRPITAAVKGQFVRFDNLVNKITTVLSICSSDVPSGNRHATEILIPGIRRCAFFYADDGYGSCHYFTLSNIKSHTP